MCLALPGRVNCIVDADPLTRTAKVSFAGLVKEINLAFVPEARVGNFVLVHAGVAITVIDEQAAATTLGYLRDAGAIDSE